MTAFILLWLISAAWLLIADATALALRVPGNPRRPQPCIDDDDYLPRLLASYRLRKFL